MMLNQRRTTGMNSKYSVMLPALTLVLALVAGIACAQGQATVTIEPADDSVSKVMVLIDGKLVEIDSAVFLRSQQVMVWLRDLEKLGWGNVEAGEPGESLLKSETVTLKFKKDQSLAHFNSLPVRLPINTYIRDGKLMVPLSFVAKALGYKYDVAIKPVVTISTQVTSGRTGSNTLTGTVLYNGEGVAKITVRAVDPKYNVIKGAIAQTDAQGNFSIPNLSDGDYRAYVYVDDNPMYFNRASDVVTLEGAADVSAPPINLGRIITPISPRVGERVPATSKQIKFSWNSIPGAEHYELKVRERGKDAIVASTEVSKTNAEIATNKFKLDLQYEIELAAYDGRGQFLGGTAGVGGDPWTFILGSAQPRFSD